MKTYFYLPFLLFYFSISAQDFQINSKSYLDDLLIYQIMEEGLTPKEKLSKEVEILADSMQRTYWGYGGCGINFFSNKYTYDTDGNLIEELEVEIMPYDSTYKNKKTISLYDTDNNLTQKTYFQWEEEIQEWLFTRKTTYTYNSYNELIERISYNWDSTAEEWVFYYKRAFFHNSYHQVDYSIQYFWNETNQEWVENLKFEYSFDFLNAIDQIITFSKNASNEWQLNSGTDYIYNQENLLIKQITYKWNIATSEWDFWSMIENFYNSDGQLILKDLPYGHEYEYTYYSNGKLKEELRKEWINGTGGWEFRERFKWFYSSYVINTSDVEINKYSIYPNPANNYIQFTSDKILEDVKLSIYNVQGKKALETVLKQNLQIDVSRFPSGVYFYRIKSKEAIQTGKFIKK